MLFLALPRNILKFVQLLGTPVDMLFCIVIPNAPTASEQVGFS